MPQVSAKTCFRTLLTTVLLLWMAWIADQHNATTLLRSTNLQLLLLAFFVHSIAFYLLLLRWQSTLSIYNALVLKDLWKSFYLGLFSNNFLPTNMGGDVVRGVLLVKQGLTIKNILVASLLDRVIGLFVTLLFCCISFSFLPQVEQLSRLAPQSPWFFLVALIILPPLGFITIKVLSHKLSQKLPEKLKTLIHQLERLADAVIANPKAVLQSMLYGIGTTFSIIICYYIISLSLGLEIPIEILFLIIPFGFFATAVPISIGGLGVREGITVFLLTRFDIPIEQGAAIAGLYLLILLGVSLPAALLLLEDRFKKV